MKVGIPRGLLYHFYKDLWQSFFDELSIETVISPETNKDIIKRGVSKTIDEACYSSKIFIGHVDYLIDKCDLIFVPRVETTGIREDYCTRLFGVYDLVKNTFPEAKLLHANTSFLLRKKFPESFTEIGVALGKSAEESLNAFKTALSHSNAKRTAAIEKQEALLKENGLKVLIAAHAYNTYDAALGKSVIKYFNENGIKVILADLIDDKTARAKTKELHKNRIYWKVNSELLGGVELLKNSVDGVVLISTFPCGPDSIFNELMIRTIKDKPVLSLVMDELDATAGLMTRLESFTDILLMRESLKNRYRTSEGIGIE